MYEVPAVHSPVQCRNVTNLDHLLCMSDLVLWKVNAFKVCEFQMITIIFILRLRISLYFMLTSHNNKSLAKLLVTQPFFNCFPGTTATVWQDNMHFTHLGIFPSLKLLIPLQNLLFFSLKIRLFLFACTRASVTKYIYIILLSL